MCTNCTDAPPSVTSPEPGINTATFELGQKVSYTTPLVRGASWCKDKRVDRSFWSKLAAYPDGHPFAEYTRAQAGPGEGIIIGVRKLANGIVGRGPGEARELHPEELFMAYQIAYDLTTGTVLVMPEDITILEENHDR